MNFPKDVVQSRSGNGVSAGRKWAGIAAAGSILFGLVHFYWAFGGRAGIADGFGNITDRKWFLAYDIVAGVIFIVIGAVAAALASNRGSYRVQTRLVAICWWGGWLALARGGLALVQDAFMLDDIEFAMVFDVVFAAGGIVYLQAARRFRADGYT